MPKNPIPDPMPDDWMPDPERAFENHVPGLEPYASMTKEEAFIAMNEAADRGDMPLWELIYEHFLDKLTARELEQTNFATALASHLIDEKGASGAAQCSFIIKVASEATQRLFHEMPPIGPAHRVN